MIDSKDYVKDIAKFQYHTLYGPDCCIIPLVLSHLGAKDLIADNATAKLADHFQHRYGLNLGTAIFTLGKFGLKKYARDIANHINNGSLCQLYDFEKKKIIWTTVGKIAEKVLKDWQIDPEKLKKQNAKGAR